MASVTTYSSTPLTTPTSVNTTAAGDQYSADALTLPNGNVVCVYGDFNNVYLRRITSAGAPTGAEVQVNVAAGVDIIKALEITGATSGNYVIEEALNEVREKVHQGVPIAQPLIENPAFPPMVAQMVKIGEETGELEKMLGKIADFYEDEVDAAIQSLTSIIEPLMMIGVGLMVGVIIIAMYMPMFKMLTLIK